MKERIKSNLISWIVAVVLIVESHMKLLHQRRDVLKRAVVNLASHVDPLTLLSLHDVPDVTIAKVITLDCRLSKPTKRTVNALDLRDCIIADTFGNVFAERHVVDLRDQRPQRSYEPAP